MKAEIVTIGTELLLGQIVDTNASWIADQLAELGIDLYYKTTVGDNKERLVKTLHKSLSRSDLVITTGGLGPTQDDITREAAAEALGVELVKSEDVLEDIKCYFHTSGRDMAENNIRQAFFPEGAEIIKNKAGTAPGFLVEQEEKVIICCPGVPPEMKQMMKKKVIPYLQEKFLKGEVIHSKVVKTCGIGESDLEEKVADILRAQTNPTIALLADKGEVKLRLTAKADNKDAAQELIFKEEKKIESRLGKYIYGYDDDTLEKVVAKQLWEQELTLAVAESCTGGLIGHRLTNVPGSSNYFDRGIVSYSNQAKQELLGVKRKTLEKYGAVSRETVEEMAAGVRKRSGTDLGLASTGIAGPGGGTEEKPVGLFYVAIADNKEVESFKYQFNGNRSKIKHMTSQMILNQLRLKLENYI